MNKQLIRICLVAVALCGCLAFAQDKKDRQARTERAIAARKPYKPHMRYTKAEWEAKIKAAREARRHKRHHTTWTQAVARRKHHTTWTQAVNRRRHTTWTQAVKHRRHRRHRVVIERRHDNGRHLGWYKGKGNPHRGGHMPPFGKAKHHRRGDNNDQGENRGNKGHKGNKKHGGG